MTLDDQIKLLAGKPELAEVAATLADLRNLITETNRDLAAHRYHFMKQRLLGYELPQQKTKPAAAPVKLDLRMGQDIGYAGRVLKFVMFRGIDLIAMDNSKQEVTIPKSRWKEIKPL